MRRRSNTIYADSLDEYIQEATSSYRASFRCSTLKRISKCVSHLSQLDYEGGNFSMKNPSLGGKMKKAEGNNQDSSTFWIDFDFDSEESCLHHVEKDGQEEVFISGALTDNTADTDCSENTDDGFPQSTKSSVVKRIMVIGLDDSGKHSLINEVFECSARKKEYKGHIMDLLMKTEENEKDKNEVRYQFWVRNLSNEDVNKGKFEDLIKMYYQKASLFVFIYSITNKESFMCLEKAIRSVLEEIPNEKFSSILLGNKCDLEEKREVSLLEGVSLQEKHKLTCFMETNHKDKSLKEKLLQVLTETEKENDEFEARKRYSILSID